jgi:protein-tyrosine phosphatase
MKTTRAQTFITAALVCATALFTATLSTVAHTQSTAQPTGNPPGCSLGFASVPNLRDVGGYMTRDGLVVRQKLLYRSSQLTKVSPGDLEKIAALGLKNIYDLRTAEERTAASDELPPGVDNVWLNVLADSDQSAPAKIMKLLQDPREANRALGDGKAEAMFVKSYREFVTLPSAKKAFHQLFVNLGKEDNLPALFHCTGGKDRTGWATAALLSLLGVPDDVIGDDFLRSNDYILPAHQKMIDAFTRAGGDPAIVKAILGAKAEYLKAAFDEMKSRYGTIEDYFSKALQIDATGQQTLRDRFLTRADGKIKT